MTERSKTIVKGRKSFVLSLTGYSQKESEIVKRDRHFIHRRNKKGLFVLDIRIEIGKGRSKILIPKEYLEYKSSSYSIIDVKTGEIKIRIEETVKIFTSSTEHETSPWGALALSLDVNENLEKDQGFFTKIGTVKGYGTGALEGAQINGRDELWKKFDFQEAPRGYAVNYARLGSITGWSSEIKSWPPKQKLNVR
jgi:hypothetical protein